MKKKLLLSVLIGGAFLALAISRVDGAKFREAMRGIESAWLVPAALIMVVAQLARTWRWWLIVRPVRDVPMSRLAPAAWVGFMAINVLPLRAGEVARPLLLRAREGIPFSAGLATCVAERAIDALAVFAMLMTSLMLIPSRTLSVGGTEVDLGLAARLLLLFFVPLTVFLVALVVFRGRAVALVERVLRPISPRLASLGARVLGSFVQGLEFFQSRALAAQVVLLTVAIWSLQVAAWWTGFRAFGFTLGWDAALAVLAVTMAGITVPGGIGMSGNFQLFAVAGLALFAIDESRAFAWSVVMNMLSFGIAVAMGLIAFPLLGVRVSAIVSRDEAEA